MKERINKHHHQEVGGTGEVGIDAVGIDKDYQADGGGTTQAGTTQVGIIQAGSGQVGIGQVGTIQVGTTQVGTIQKHNQMNQ